MPTVQEVLKQTDLSDEQIVALDAKVDTVGEFSQQATP